MKRTTTTSTAKFFFFFSKANFHSVYDAYGFLSLKVFGFGWESKNGINLMKLFENHTKVKNVEVKVQKIKKKKKKFVCCEQRKSFKAFRE